MNFLECIMIMNEKININFSITITIFAALFDFGIIDNRKSKMDNQKWINGK